VYIPAAFKVDDPAVLYDVMRQNSFATVISNGDGEPFASHLPLLIEEGMLIGHMAKANPHWKMFDGRSALCIFSGPHAYVSPRIYATAPNVPTWNYVTVHAYGKPEIIEDTEASLKILEDSLDHFDPQLERTPELAEYLRKQLPGIVAFHMPIDRLEGKFKLNQNKKPEDRNAVIETFTHSNRTDEREVANAMAGIYNRG